MAAFPAKYRIDVNSREQLAAKTLGLKEIGLCNIATTPPVAFDPYEDNHDTGAFILIDRRTNETAAAGATNIHRHDYSVTRAALWFTGLSSAGKSTIANIVDAASPKWRG